mmetsp:Transcript_611/g.1134  ORF Transcript_611/g.1134 Transcript_611/m.1134 type:complete len:299 (-) Transcript_611:152-1048(-)
MKPSSISKTAILAGVVLTVLLSTLAPCGGFIALHQTSRNIRPKVRQQLQAAKKGFGSSPTPQQPKKAKKSSQPPPASPAQPTPKEDNSTASSTTTTTTTTNPFEYSEPDISMGKVALDRLRRERAEARNQELQKLKEVQQVDQLIRESPEAAVIPEKVAQRMGKRMLPFVGIPLIGSMASFVGFWYMATYRDMEFQPALVATTSIVLLAVGLVGITYSIMSASWDPDREGSFFGTEEFSQNIDNIKTGLARSRENAILRDKMETGVISQEELEKAMAKETKKEKKTASFNEKMGDEMD